MANILIKQGLEIAVPDFVITTDEARKVDLTSIIQTGTTSSQAISLGTYFYLNNVLVRAKADIANGATFTLNTNYEVVTAGALNEINDTYSTTAIRVGTWVDGTTPVYRKAYPLGAISPNGIAYLDSSLKNNKVVAYGGYLTVGANIVILPYINVSAVTYSCQVQINTTNGLTFIAGGQLTASGGYLWVDYI